MRKMDFGSTWISWISKCVTTVSISVLVNGVPTEEFPMAKGIRQGCSLSPMLFNIVGELLNLLLHRVVSEGLFSGMVISMEKGTFKLSHLQFADDLIIFCGASEKQVMNVKRVLRVFEVISGLQLNLKKSKLFGVNMNEEEIRDWQIRWVVLLWFIVSTKLAGWKASSLSMAGVPASVTSLSILSCPTSYGAEEMVRTRFIGWVGPMCQTEIRRWIGVPNIDKGPQVHQMLIWKNVLEWICMASCYKLAVKSALVKRGDSCSPNSKLIATVINWSPPPKGFIKLNVDAATTTDWKRSGIGGVLRDDNGTIIDSYKESDRLIIESDCRVAVDWVRDFVSCPVVYAYIVKDIIEKLRLCEGVIRWVNRAANLEADTLAKAGIG
ncbi:uncharacterized protein LOC120211616 [Hibiscus syriacus]|uniref:uncharacterized protein LOC120211616 n=1 Tax=Hibiscus syriacus TaxID=106335 RepID=UPI001921D86B|nr:uncharacterized protein LOC120211616 [Hibiscus syriacus]